MRSPQPLEVRDGVSETTAALRRRNSCGVKPKAIRIAIRGYSEGDSAEGSGWRGFPVIINGNQHGDHQWQSDQWRGLPVIINGNQHGDQQHSPGWRVRSPEQSEAIRSNQKQSEATSSTHQVGECGALHSDKQRHGCQPLDLRLNGQRGKLDECHSVG